MVSAAELYCCAFAESPAFSASAAITRAWRVLALSFSSSDILELRRNSLCFWLAMTLAACSLSRMCALRASVIACSSCTLGSARSLNEPVSFAVRYFHHFLTRLNMWSILGGRRGAAHPPTAEAA